MSNVNASVASIISKAQNGAVQDDTGADDLNALMKKMQEAQAKGDMQGMQAIAKQMMGEASKVSKDTGTDANSKALLELANKAAGGDTGALKELETKANAMLQEAHASTDLGVEGSRFMGTAQAVDVQQLQQQKPVENASRASGVSFDTLLSNTPVNAISQSAISEDAPAAPGGGVRGAKAQDAQSTTDDELFAAGLGDLAITYKDGVPVRPTAAFDDESMLLSVNIILEKPDVTLPTQVNTRNGDVPLSSQLESAASGLESDISALSSSITSMEKDIKKEENFIAEATATISKLNELIDKLKLESDALIANGSIMLAAGTLYVGVAIGLKLTGSSLLTNPFTAPAGTAILASGIALMITALALIASGTAMIIIGKQKKDEMEANIKTRDEVQVKLDQAKKRKEMLQKKVDAAKVKKTQMEAQKKLAQEAQAKAQTNETAAGPALGQASDQYSEAKNALDQLKADTPNPPTTAQKAAITALTAMVDNLDKKLNDMYAPVNKGEELKQPQKDAFSIAMAAFTTKINAEYAKLNAQGNIT